MREYEKRFARLEERLNKSSEALREDLKKRFDSLESYVREEPESLGQRLKAEKFEPGFGDALRDPGFRPRFVPHFRGAGLNRLNVGDLDVWIDEGPYAILACVIRGIAPRELRERMAEVLENVHREYSAQLDLFDGETSPFVKVGGELSRCLELRYRKRQRRKVLDSFMAPRPSSFCLSPSGSAGVPCNTPAGIAW